MERIGKETIEIERIDNQMQKFRHFSHEHPLEATSSPSKQSKTCAGCKLTILSGKDYYRCSHCQFFLHEVCYNMPRRTRHPAHPNHYLELHPSSPSRTKGALKCQACGNHVTGFHYDCAECGLYYHSLCSSLPFSISTSSHPHALKLSIAPPFDLYCDICNEPGYDVWLYRCHICEFDGHISCAISNQPVLEVPQNLIPQLPTNEFSRQSRHSTSSFGTNVPENYNIEGNELLQLVRQIVFKGNRKSNGEEVENAAVSGWDQRLYSPKENFNVNSSKLGHGGSLQEDSEMVSTSMNPKDPAIPVSEDLGTMTPSFQFSDAYFSIELANSYSAYGQKNQAKKESEQQGPKETSDGQGALSYRNSTIAPKDLSSLKPAKQPSFGYGAGNYSNKVGLENRMNEAFLTRGDTLTRKELGPEMKRRTGETMVRSNIGNQNTKSDSEMLSTSCWQSLSCCNPGYERSTN